jgi:hypothetical protein
LASQTSDALFQEELGFIQRREAAGRYAAFPARAFRLLGLLALLPFVVLLALPRLRWLLPPDVMWPYVAVWPAVTLFTVLHVVLLLRALLRGWQTVARERSMRQRWDAFVLTGVDARQMVVSKWWAAVVSLRKTFMAWAFMRAGLLLVFYLLHQTRAMYITTLDTPPPFVLPPVGWLLLAAGIVAAQTLLLLPLLAACGVLATLGGHQFPPNPFRAFTLALLVMVGSAVFLMLGVIVVQYYAVYLLQSNIDPKLIYSDAHHELTRVIMLIAFGMADGGLISNAILVPSILYVEREQWNTVLSALVLMLLYAVWTWAALRLGSWFAVRRGMAAVGQA